MSRSTTATAITIPRPRHLSNFLDHVSRNNQAPALFCFAKGNLVNLSYGFFTDCSHTTPPGFFGQAPTQTCVRRYCSAFPRTPPINGPSSSCVKLLQFCRACNLRRHCGNPLLPLATHCQVLSLPAELFSQPSLNVLTSTLQVRARYVPSYTLQRALVHPSRGCLCKVIRFLRVGRWQDNCVT
jgi:hypothetical protein